MTKLRYHHKHRHATWLELFFDLVFVASIRVVAHNLAYTKDNQIPTEQLFLFPIEFLTVWWIWASHTLYANRFDTDSSIYRFVTLGMMFLIVSMSAFLGEGFFENYDRFILFYVSIRLIMAFLYFRSLRKLEESRDYAKYMGYSIVAGALICGSSVLFDSPYREIVLIAGILVEMAAAIAINKKTNVDPIHREHFVERVGLMSIILLGETFINMLSGLRYIEWDAHNMMAAMTGFVMIGSIWWIYFDSFNTMARFKSMSRGYILLYSHVFLAMGLVLLANVIKHAIVLDLNMHDFQILAITGMCFFYIGKQLPYYVHLPPYRINIIINSVVCIAITVASTFLPRPEYALIGMTLGMLFYTYSNFKWTLTKDASAYLSKEN